MNSVGRRMAVPARYLAFSGLSFGVNLGITAGLHDEVGVDYLVAAAVTIGSSFAAKYAVHDSWLFSRSGA